MFNTKTATTNNEDFTSSYMPVGINDNCILKSVEIQTTTQGKKFLRITFEDDQQRTAEMSEFENTKGMYIKTDEDLQNANNRQFGRLLQIVKCYFTEIPDVELNTFVDMINWIKSTLDPLIPTKKKLRLKVIYNKRGYSTVSSNGIFVEPMDIKQTQIKLFKRDLLERPIKADEEKPADPLAMTNSTPVTENTDDLPF